MSKNAHRAVALLFVLFLAVIFALNLLTPDREFSPRENRWLQTSPALSAASLFSGEYTQKAETWFSDQFVWRDRWISLKARMELLLGKKENNGVFLCRDQRLLETFDAPAPDVLIRQIDAVNTFTDNAGIPVTLALIPSAGEIYADLLPYGAAAASQTDTIRDVYAAARCDTAALLPLLMEHRDEYIYYRTDHHWTTLGAYYAYQALSGALGYTANVIGSYQPRTVSEDFLGTEYSSSGFFWVASDRMETYVDDPGGLQIEKYETESPAVGSLYDEEMLQTKDKYRFYLGGNTPRAVIRTGNEELPSLLIIRDSYTDSLLPFLLAHYSEIHLLDLRYYLDSVREYVAENSIDSVLILYSVDDFCADRNIGLLAG